MAYGEAFISFLLVVSTAAHTESEGTPDGFLFFFVLGMANGTIDTDEEVNDCRISMFLDSQKLHKVDQRGAFSRGRRRPPRGFFLISPSVFKFVFKHVVNGLVGGESFQRVFKREAFL